MHMVSFSLELTSNYINKLTTLRGYVIQGGKYINKYLSLTFFGSVRVE